MAYERKKTPLAKTSGRGRQTGAPSSSGMAYRKESTPLNSGTRTRTPRNSGRITRGRRTSGK